MQRIIAQSAMEYLMTYGWAFLVIAVVLGIFYQLGLFGSFTSTPKASSGSCTVFRQPAITSLVGQCAGLNPQFKLNFSQSPAGTVTANVVKSSSSQITVAFWIYPQDNGFYGNALNYWQAAVGGGSLAGACAGASYYFYIETGTNPPRESWSIASSRNFPVKNLVLNTWQQLVGTFDGSNLIVYYNGAQVGPTVAANGNVLGTYPKMTISGPADTAVAHGCNPVSGSLSNLQIYNTSLSAAEVQGLYREGLGGPPVQLQNLIGWWQLNGNLNDYSGNNQNGAAFNSIFYKPT